MRIKLLLPIGLSFLICATSIWMLYEEDTVFVDKIEDIKCRTEALSVVEGPDFETTVCDIRTSNGTALPAQVTAINRKRVKPEVRFQAGDNVMIKETRNRITGSRRYTISKVE